MNKKNFIIFATLLIFILVGCGDKNKPIVEGERINTEQFIPIDTLYWDAEIIPPSEEEPLKEEEEEEIEEEYTLANIVSYQEEYEEECYEEDEEEYWEDDEEEYWEDDGYYVSPTDFRRLGVLYWGGWRWTYYSERVLPGGGLNIPGRWSDGTFVRDENGFICLASSSVGYGTIVGTPWGTGCVYDSGCSAGTMDVYVSW